ncbi:hypothetical protein [Tritonibacter horizontis]|uniref:Uncharacterized protein n=1 Tax=Tritonibacter horizontis TaxID=1768241 RepID=A0A132C1E5_9RHOB|nr:hypothetical protein [Tritonibacter horizontis]KUP94445.1 hypothetical protein TRIHO_06700 [Tritonibacter horizontis]
MKFGEVSRLTVLGVAIGLALLVQPGGQGRADAHAVAPLPPQVAVETCPLDALPCLHT